MTVVEELERDLTKEGREVRQAARARDEETTALRAIEEEDAAKKAIEKEEVQRVREQDASAITMGGEVLRATEKDIVILGAGKRRRAFTIDYK